MTQTSGKIRYDCEDMDGSRWQECQNEQAADGEQKKKTEEREIVRKEPCKRQTAALW